MIFLLLSCSILSFIAIGAQFPCIITIRMILSQIGLKFTLPVSVFQPIPEKSEEMKDLSKHLHFGKIVRNLSRNIATYCW